MIRSVLFLLLVLLLAGCCRGSVNTSAMRPDQLEFPPLQFSFPETAQSQLENGFRVYLKEDHELPLVDLTLLIGGGSIHDSLDQTGLSQLFAASMETGGAGELTPAELEAELEALAINLSVSSSTYDYQVNMSLHRRDLPRGVEILADLLRRPLFDKERFELARSQMLEGIRRKNDDPGTISSRLLAQAVFPQHPFGSTPQLASVEKVTRDELLQLHQDYFRPDNLWLAVSGDVTATEMLALLGRSFADWNAPLTPEPVLPPLPDPPGGGVLIADKQIPQTSILMGHVGISKDNPDLFPLRVANYILGGGGFNSRLMREVRSNRGLAYSVYSYFQVGRHLPEMFIVGTETKTGSTVEVVELMRELMQQLIDTPVTEKELELARQSLINSFVFAFTDSHSVVSRKLRLDFYNYPAEYMETYQQKVSEVTIADVQRVARRYLHPDQLKIVLVGESGDFAKQAENLGLPVTMVELTEE